MKAQKTTDLVFECELVGLTMEDVLFALERRRGNGAERKTLKVTLESTDFTEEELRLIFEKMIQVLRE